MELKEKLELLKISNLYLIDILEKLTFHSKEDMLASYELSLRNHFGFLNQEGKILETDQYKKIMKYLE